MKRNIFLITIMISFWSTTRSIGWTSLSLDQQEAWCALIQNLEPFATFIGMYNPLNPFHAKMSDIAQDIELIIKSVPDSLQTTDHYLFFKRSLENNILQQLKSYSTLSYADYQTAQAHRIYLATVLTTLLEPKFLCNSDGDFSYTYISQKRITFKSTQPTIINDELVAQGELLKPTDILIALDQTKNLVLSTLDQITKNLLLIKNDFNNIKLLFTTATDNESLFQEATHIALTLELFAYQIEAQKLLSQPDKYFIRTLTTELQRTGNDLHTLITNINTLQTIQSLPAKNVLINQTIDLLISNTIDKLIATIQTTPTFDRTIKTDPKELTAKQESIQKEIKSSAQQQSFTKSTRKQPAPSTGVVPLLFTRPELHLDKTQKKWNRASENPYYPYYKPKP